MLKKTPILYWVIVLIWIAYVILALNAPTTGANPFHLSAATIDILRATIILPYLLIWLLGVFSYLRLRSYAQEIAGSKEAIGFVQISRGVGILVLGFILSSLIGAWKSYVAGQEGMEEALTIISNYALILPYLLAFAFIAHGAFKLLAQQTKSISLTKPALWSVVLLVITYIWLDLIFSNPLRASSANSQVIPTYFLSDSLIVMTVVLPSLLTWILGLFGVAFLTQYYKGVKGVIYRRALLYFTLGAVGVTIASIFIEVLTALGPIRLVRLGYGPILGLVYLFFLIVMVGFGFIAYGARKLRKIETV